MVSSRLNGSVNYIENKNIDIKDENAESCLWEIKKYGVPFHIILGNIQYDYEKKGIIYLNIYIVLDETEIDEKIGVFEIQKSELPIIKQQLEDDELDMRLLGSPLFFSFVDKEYLEDYSLSKGQEEEESEQEGQEGQEEEEEEEGQEEKEEEKESEQEENMKSVELETQSEEEQKSQEQESDIDIEEYLTQEENWINTYLNKQNYNIIDNEGGGDCLFSVIRDAFKKTTSSPLSVKKLREIVAQRLTNEQFEHYYELYSMLNDISKVLLSDKQKLENDKQTLIQRFKNTEDIEEKKVIVKEIDKIKKELEYKIREIKNNKTDKKEFDFMKNINTQEELREKIKTCEFWADSWAIHVLEKAMGLKIIILSSQNYSNGELDNVLQCGSVPDEKEGVFQPKYYILAEHTGDHYKLITYKDQTLFNFKAIPLEIKKLIINKCLERQSGVYSYIPDFIELKKPVESERIKKMSPQEKEEQMSIKSQQEKGNKEKDLYYDEGEGTVFQFYYKSANKSPGKGAGESINPKYIEKYKKLAVIDDWRKKLSNSYIAPVIIDDLTWNSVEHFYQGSKYKKNNPDFYYLFSVNSESEISKDPEIAKGAGEKSGIYKGKQYREKSIIMDDDFFTSGRNAVEMETALFAKFSNHQELQNVLMQTKDAKLQQFMRGRPPVVLYELMNVRRKLR